jgi:probable blue pigment (indigoidine) exporter
MWLRLLLVSMLTIGGWVAFMGLALLWLNASEAAVLGISIPVWAALPSRCARNFANEKAAPLEGAALRTHAIVLVRGAGVP